MMGVLWTVIVALLMLLALWVVNKFPSRTRPKSF
jgi:hypothetical protein